MDETTVNRWLTKRKTWTTDLTPITLPMQPDRKGGVSIFGAIGGNIKDFGGDPVGFIY